jgi:hypothetical protein
MISPSRQPFRSGICQFVASIAIESVPLIAALAMLPARTAPIDKTAPLPMVLN